MKSINPYLNFNGNAEEAFKFYQSVFGGELQMVRYKDLEDKMGLTGEELNQVANVILPLIGDTLLYGSDTPNQFQKIKQGNNVQINIETENIAEAEKLFKALSENGEINMPLQETEWAERFSMFYDRFGVQWMIMFSGNKS